MDKRGLELSLTVIVLIILSIIIFIGGISLVWKFFAGAEEIKGGIEMQTKQQIESLLRQGNELVAIPINTKKAPVGSETTFGLGIRNIIAEQGFYIQIDAAEPPLYDQKGKEIQGVSASTEFIEENWLGGFREQGPIMIKQNQYELVPLRIRAASSVDFQSPTPRGSIVVFNVCVFAGQAGGECVIQNAGATYDKKIHQLFIEVR